MFWTNRRVHRYKSLTGHSVGKCSGGVACPLLLNIVKGKHEEPNKDLNMFDLHKGDYRVFSVVVDMDVTQGEHCLLLIGLGTQRLYGIVTL